jgi:tetratricopeptide (TPR) repeat protein
VREALHRATGADFRNRGLMLLRADGFRPAYQDFARALESNSSDAAALDGLTRSGALAKMLDDAKALVTKLASEPGNTAAKLTLSRLLASQGAFDESVRIPLALLQADPSNLAALEQLASVLSDAGDGERLAPVVARMMASAPGNTWSHYYAAALFFIQQRPGDALREARLAVEADPSNAKAHNLIGASLASLGDRDRARAAFEASLKADPRDPGTYTNLATLELEGGNVGRAKQYFAEALTIDPTSATARQGLANAVATR